jgi:hypothetical protein
MKRLSVSLFVLLSCLASVVQAHHRTKAEVDAKASAAATEQSAADSARDDMDVEKNAADQADDDADGLYWDCIWAGASDTDPENTYYDDMRGAGAKNTNPPYNWIAGYMMLGDGSYNNATGVEGYADEYMDDGDIGMGLGDAEYAIQIAKPPAQQDWDLAYAYYDAARINYYRAYTYSNACYPDAEVKFDTAKDWYDSAASWYDDILWAIEEEED